MARTRSARMTLVGGLLLCLVMAACSNANDDLPVVGQPEVVVTPTTATATPDAISTPDATSAPRSPVPTAAASPEPVSTPSGSDLRIGGSPSQSYDDAIRDGVLPEVADLSFADRVEVQAEVTVQGQRWVLSRFPQRMRPFIASLGIVPGSIDAGSSELLQLEGDQIARSVPLMGSPATSLTATDDVIYAGRRGDGGYPDTSVVRVDLTNDEVTRLLLPYAYIKRPRMRNPDWQVVAPSSASTLHEATLALWQSDSDAASLAALDQAIDAASTTEPSVWPTLALSRSGCVPFPIERLYDFGTHCVTELQDPDTGESSVTVADAQVPGSLVGAGWMDKAGPTFAAIVPPDDDSSGETPLLFVDVNDPSVMIDTGIDGRTEGSHITQVSFFDGGFLTTTAVDLSTTVHGFDSSFAPLPEFVSPTNQDRGYPPDPFISHAVISPNGRRVVTTEREWPVGGAGVPGRGLAIIFADANTGEQVQRVELDLDTDEYVQWLDFDGRWAVISFQKIGSERHEMPVMVDITSGEVYPLGINQPAILTIERTPAPEEPRVRLMTPGPYTHGQTSTMRMTAGKLLVQHGEQVPEFLGPVHVCRDASDFAPCTQLPVTRQTPIGAIPTEVDVTVTELVGHQTTGDVVEDTSYHCAVGGCVLRLGTRTIPINFIEQAAPPVPIADIRIDDLTATVQIESAVFDDQLVVLVCFRHGSDAEEQHRATAGRALFCTGMTRVDVSNGQAQADIELRPDIAAACAINQCSVRLFFE